MKKLDNKYFGEFTIKEVINSHAYRLELPHELQTIHNVFHTSLLLPSPSDPLPGQQQSIQQPIGLDDEGEPLWAIDSITDSRRRRKVFEYKIRWRGYDEETWEPLSSIVTAVASIRAFQERFPRKPRPTKTELSTAKALLKTQISQIQQASQHLEV